MHHKSHHRMTNFHQSMPEASSHGLYKNEVEKPEMAAQNHPGPGEGDMPGMGCRDYKGQADPIVYGQAGGKLGMKDESRIHGQFKDYHWD